MKSIISKRYCQINESRVAFATEYLLDYKDAKKLYNNYEILQTLFACNSIHCEKLEINR